MRLHITGMGLSYILLLTAFYVDNGKSLPLWKDLPPITYWLLPAAVGLPLIIHALSRRSAVDAVFVPRGVAHSIRSDADQTANARVFIDAIGAAPCR